MEEKVYVATPAVSATDGLTVTLSTATETVPVGMVVLEEEFEATVIVMTSFAPEATDEVAAATVVTEAASEVEPLQAVSKLLKSIDPSPVARS